MSNTSPLILVVDDDRLVLRTVEDELTDAGYGVVTAETAAQAVAVSRRTRPDLAIIDVELPDQPGARLAQNLRQELEVDFIYLSAHSDEARVSDALAEGGLAYLVKPMDGKLLPAVRAALNLAARLKAHRGQESKLNLALEANRETSVSVGVIMERFRFTQQEAFEVLRGEARSQRRRLNEVAHDVVKAVETLNRSAAGGRG